jgi:hypothetical protein
MPPVLNRYVPTNLSPMTQQAYDARYRTTAACVRTSLIKQVDTYDAPYHGLVGSRIKPTVFRDSRNSTLFLTQRVIW